MSHLRTIVIRAARSGGIATAIIRRGGTYVINSETAPTDTNALWFDPSDGSLSRWNGAVWVETGWLPRAADGIGWTIVTLTAADYAALTVEQQLDPSIYYIIIPD